MKQPADVLKIALAALSLVSASCTTYQVREHPRREVATYQMEVINPDGTRQWKTTMRAVHEFEFPENSERNEK